MLVRQNITLRREKVVIIKIRNTVKMTIQNRAFEADTNKILDIVIHSLYSNREIFTGINI